LEKQLKIEMLLQSVLEPIETQTKEALIATIGAVNQRQIAFGNHADALHDYPNVSQTRGNQ
jgi:hypothetical protein